MESTRPKTKAADRRTLEKQEGTVSPQGKTQRGRSVRTKQTDTQASTQMTEASTISQGKTISYAGAAASAPIQGPAFDVRKITPKGASGRKLRVPEIKMNCPFKPKAKIQNAVHEAIQELRKENWVEANALPLCLAVAKKIDDIRNMPDAEDKPSYDFIKFQMGPYYSDCLGLALASLQHQADIECSWEYYEELNLLAQYFNFQSQNFHAKEANKRALTKLYRRFVENELNYLKYIQDSPCQSSVRHACHIINWLLGESAPASYFGYLDRDTINKFLDDEQRIMQKINSKMADETPSQHREKINDLEREVFAADATNMQAKRKYHDILREQLEEVMKKSKMRDVTDQQRACLLEILAGFCQQYTDSVKEFHSLRRDLKVLLPAVAQRLLLAIRDSSSNVDRLKAESLDLILRLGKDGWLDSECRRLYKSCMQPQAVRTESGALTYTQYSQDIDSIFSRMRDATNTEQFLAVARMLKTMLDEKEHEIKKLDMAHLLLGRIEKIKETLYFHLFMKIFKSHNRYKDLKMKSDEIDAAMSQYQRDFVNLIPYQFVLKDEETKENWRKTACAVWRKDLVRLSAENSFNEEDADILLYLKDIAPEVPNKFIRHRVEDALIPFFRVLLKDDTGAIPIDKAWELSEWIDELNEISPVNRRLQQLNKKWKTKRGDTTSETPMTTPTVAGAQAAGKGRISPPPVPKAAVAQPEPEEHSISRSSSTSESAIVFPEAWNKIKGEPTFTFGFFDEPEQSEQPAEQKSQEPSRLRGDAAPFHPRSTLAYPGVRPQMMQPSTAPHGIPALSAYQSPEQQQPRFHPMQPVSMPLHYPLRTQSTGGGQPAVLPQKYRPMHYVVVKMDNSNMVRGQEYLINAALLSLANASLLTDPSGAHFPQFKEGVRCLVEWLIQINGNLIDKDVIQDHLMQLANEDGYEKIQNLFGRFLQLQYDNGNFAAASNLCCLRNYLFSIRLLMGLRR